MKFSWQTSIPAVSGPVFSSLAVGVLAVLTPLSSGCKKPGFPEHPKGYREYVYVTNGGSNTVSIFDVVNLRLDRQLTVGQNPTGVTANPKRNEIYVVNTGSANSNGSVSVIDADKNILLGNIPVHRQPYFIDVDSDGSFGYVANSGSNSVSVLDLKAHREVAVLPAGQAPGLARISPDGKSLVVTNRLGNSISIFDPQTRKLRSVFSGCPGATDAVILPDSKKAFVACSAGHQVMSVNLAQAAGKDQAARPDQLVAMLNVGRSPVHLAMKPDGGEIFVSDYDSDSISEISTTTNDVGGAFLMGSNPVQGIVNAANSILFVSDFRSQEITLYAIDDGKRSISIPVGDAPDAMAFSADGQFLFVADAHSGDIAVIRTNPSPTLNRLFTLLPSGRQPNAIADKVVLP